jgi:hypothetical protein
MDAVIVLRAAKPTHLDASPFTITCLHIASDGDKFFDEPFFVLCRANAESCYSVRCLLNLVEQVIGLPAEIEPVEELVIERRKSNGCSFGIAYFRAKVARVNEAFSGTDQSRTRVVPRSSKTLDGEHRRAKAGCGGAS